MQFKNIDDIKGKYKDNDVLLIELNKGDRYVGFFYDTTKFKTHPKGDIYLRTSTNPKTILHHRILQGLFVEYCLPIKNIIKIQKLQG